MPTAVIFDLDGTLVQTREASWRVFEPIARRHGLPVTRPEDFYELFASNFFAGLRAMCGDRSDAVAADFLTALDAHYLPAMVPGLVDVIRQMTPRTRLAVLSSNTTAVVRRVLRENGLEYCFSHVFGGDVEPDKTVGIARFLSDAARGAGRLCEAWYDEPGETDPRADAVADPSEVVLVTDTVGDVQAAMAAGIRAVGVAWGMHTEQQLLAAGAEFVAIWPQELLSHLYGAPLEATEPAAPRSDSTAERQRAAAATRRDRRLAATCAVPTTSGRRPNRSAAVDAQLADAIARTIR